MCFYNIRCLKGDSNLHRDPRMLDSKYLIDQLYKYYEHFYSKIFFKETMILVIFWAHQKNMLNHVISEEALKLLVICIFINFGYGVRNVIREEADNPQKINYFRKMNSYSKLNSKGETEIMEELKTQFHNYTIQEKRGFYLPAKKKYMQIKDIVPVYYPLLPL